MKIKNDIWIPDSTFCKKPSLITRVSPANQIVRYYQDSQRKGDAPILLETAVVNKTRSKAEDIAIAKVEKANAKAQLFTVNPVNDNSWRLSIWDPYHQKELVSEQFEGNLGEALEKARLLALSQERAKSHILYAYKEPEQTQRGSRLGRIKGDYR